MSNLKQSSKEKAYNITSTFEGAGFSNMAGNFDGQYLSYGTFQWNFGMGTLQPLFTRLFNEYQYVADNCLPEGGKWLKNAIENGWEKEWALQIQDENHNIVDPWKSALYNLGQTSEFQKIEMDATEPYINTAINLCNTFGLYTERAFCLFFDIAIQNGSIPYYEMAKTEYHDKLVSIATVCANRSKDWHDIVLARKMCIVNGYGYVNGANMTFDISDESAFEDNTVEDIIPEATQSINLLAEHKIITNVTPWIQQTYDGGTIDGMDMYYLISKFVACYYDRPDFNEVLYTLSCMILKDGTAIISDTAYWMEGCQEGKTVEGKNVEVVINRMAKYIRENS